MRLYLIIRQTFPLVVATQSFSVVRPVRLVISEHLQAQPGLLLRQVWPIVKVHVAQADARVLHENSNGFSE